MTELETESIRRTLIRSAESGSDYGSALDLAIQYATSSDDGLRTNAFQCFGYMARVYRKLDLDRVLLILRHAAKGDSDWRARGAAQDALGDMTMFLPSFKE